MKQIVLGGKPAPSVVVGCMRFAGFDTAAMTHYLHTALELGACFFDHADIYGDGQSEAIFGQALRADSSLRREEMILQSKCGIRKGRYDLSKEHILRSVDGILERLGVEYLDVLLLHRPDALVEPEEVAAAFDALESAGKVRAFGVSNHKPMQIELLKKYVRQPLIANQLQFSLPASNLIANGMEVNMTSDGAEDRDGSALDYCRLHEITIQAWSPFQRPAWQGPFIDSDACPTLNEALSKASTRYGVSATTVASAWILRHPAHMQLIAGTTNENRLREIIAGGDVALSREDWYKLYLAAGHPLP